MGLARRFRVNQAQRARVQMHKSYGVGNYKSYLSLLKGGKGSKDYVSKLRRKK
jgi:hypothetical protein